MITPLLRMNFAKIVMVICNYSDAGDLRQYPWGHKVFTSREKYYAQPLARRLDFFQWLNYFLYVGAQPIGPMHEYYDFEQFINFKGHIAKKPETANFQPAFERFGQAILCCVITVTISKYIDVTYM